MKRRWVVNILPALLALIVVGPVAWMATDRAPPIELDDGIITPNIVHRPQWMIEDVTQDLWRNIDTGELHQFSKEFYAGMERPPAMATITWRKAKVWRDCPGNTQRELVDSHRTLFPYLTRSRAGTFHPDYEGSNTGTLTTPVLLLPSGMAPGFATYRVQVFFYCNVLQRLLDWPIAVTYPTLTFQVIYTEPLVPPP